MLQKKKDLKGEDPLKAILASALEGRASDIHIEPLSDALRIRFRVDGILQEYASIPLYEYESILNRIKIASDIPLVRHTMPVEGHLSASIGQLYAESGSETSSSLTDKLSNLFIITKTSDQQKRGTIGITSPEVSRSAETTLDVRVSIFPVVEGEAAVLRVLNRQETLVHLENLGMGHEDLATLKRLIARTYGMILVTGPAGSGKSTTLYSILQSLRSKEKNIITLEDPVEYRFKDIRQSEIKPDQGYNYADGMRSILRQDPDIIMIGEIRDADTAEYTIRASLTGRLVFSTIHSNTTVGTIARLFDMNIERSLIAYALNGIISQRLIRKICDTCRSPYMPDPEYLLYFGLDQNSYSFTRGKCCEACSVTGYYGRTGIYEVLELDNNLRSLIIERSSMSVLQEYVASTNMKTLKDAAREKVLTGITTIEEAAKAV